MTAAMTAVCQETDRLPPRAVKRYLDAEATAASRVYCVSNDTDGALIVAAVSQGGTVTRDASSRHRRRAGGAALFVVLHADSPAASGARFVLRGIDRVTIGRGSRRGSRVLGDDALHISLPDGRISVEHARLDRAQGRWTVTDLGSKNGSFVNGAPRSTAHPLEDGDWIEIGHTFLRFRESTDSTDDFDAADVARAELSTLVPTFQAELDKLDRVADKRVPMLLSGETGSGKELIARALHARSSRSGAFIAVNCGAIPPNLVEATLFGHRRGSFTGAVDDQPGLIASADRGTLLLDEIGDLPLVQQPALLRVVQEMEVLHFGDARPKKVDVRFVAATHRDLDALVRQNRFRADLLARLAGIRITIPPLRERIEDLGILVAAIVAREGSARCTIDRDAAWALCRHHWPLNVRELEQALTAALALSVAGKISIQHLPEALRSGRRAPTDRDEARRNELIALLHEHAGNLAAVARALKTSRAQIHRLLERFGIDPRDRQ